MDEEVEGAVLAQQVLFVRGECKMSVDSLPKDVLLQVDQAGGPQLTVKLSKDSAISLGHLLISEAEHVR